MNPRISSFVGEAPWVNSDENDIGVLWTLVSLALSGVVVISGLSSLKTQVTFSLSLIFLSKEADSRSFFSYFDQ